MGYSLQLRDLIQAPSHRQDSLCYTNCGAVAGMKISSKSSPRGIDLKTPSHHEWTLAPCVECVFKWKKPISNDLTWWKDLHGSHAFRHPRHGRHPVRLGRHADGLVRVVGTGHRRRRRRRAAAVDIARARGHLAGVEPAAVATVHRVLARQAVGVVRAAVPVVRSQGLGLLLAPLALREHRGNMRVLLLLLAELLPRPRVRQVDAFVVTVTTVNRVCVRLVSVVRRAGVGYRLLRNTALKRGRKEIYI